MIDVVDSLHGARPHVRHARLQSLLADRRYAETQSRAHSELERLLGLNLDAVAAAARAATEKATETKTEQQRFHAAWHRVWGVRLREEMQRSIAVIGESFAGESALLAWTPEVDGSGAWSPPLFST